MVDAGDLKSLGLAPCRFESGRPHQRESASPGGRPDSHTTSGGMVRTPRPTTCTRAPSHPPPICRGTNRDAEPAEAPSPSALPRSRRRTGARQCLACRRFEASFAAAAEPGPASGLDRQGRRLPNDSTGSCISPPGRVRPRWRRCAGAGWPASSRQAPSPRLPPSPLPDPLPLPPPPPLLHPWSPGPRPHRWTTPTCPLLSNSMPR